MNIYEKLQTCRVDLQNANIKKTGKNDHTKRSYYELGDFLPAINKLMLQYKLTTRVCFSDMATLTIIDTDKPESTIEFTSPIAAAKLANCHEVQNMGASQTYIRRYLYTNAFEIVESDILDAGKADDKPQDTSPKKATPPAGVKLISNKQRSRLFAIAKGNEDLLREICTKCGYESTKDISMADYNAICDLVESSEVNNPFEGGK